MVVDRTPKKELLRRKAEKQLSKGSPRASTKREGAEADTDQIRLGMALEAAEMVTWEWDIPTRSVRYSDNIQSIVRGAAVEPYCSLDALMPEIHPEDRERLAQALDQTSKQGIPFECEYRVHMLDGTYRWILGKGKRVILEDGKPVRVLGLSMDITERKQAEKALRESQALLSAVMEGTPDPVYVKDDQSRIIMANPALAKVVGKPLQEILGRTDSEYYGDIDTGQVLREHDLRVMKSGQSEVTEETVPTPRGCRTFLSTKTPYRNASGDIIGITGISRDITERKQAEEAQRASEERLRRMIETSPVAIGFGDSTGKIFEANESFYRLYP